MMGNLKQRFNFLEPNGNVINKTLATQVALLEEKVGRMGGQIDVVSYSTQSIKLLEERLNSVNMRIKGFESMQENLSQTVQNV